VKPTRRSFLCTATALARAASAGPGRYLILTRGDASFLARLAARELLRGLVSLGLPGEVRLAGTEEKPGPGGCLLRFEVSPASFQNSESYAIRAAGAEVTFAAAGERAVLYAVFDFLERQGAFFGIDGDSYPLEPPRSLVLPPSGGEWNASPRFAARGLLPWPDFLSGVTNFNDEDFRAYFEAMLRMRFNTFALHVYAGGPTGAESYLSFDYAGAGHNAFLDTSATGRWGFLPRRTSQFTMGAAQFYDREVFGSDAARFAADPWDAAERARLLLRKSLAYAKRLGLATGIGFEPYQVPDEILRALPPEAKPYNVESPAARKVLEARLGQLLEAYPDVDHVWLWDTESASWDAQKGRPATLSVTPFQQAHDFLRRHAPKTRLVLSGWGGAARHFEDLHQRLPMDVVFACLNDMTGWDPVSEAFAKLEGRDRWPIPWLEDDPGIWLPQFLVNRLERDMNLAERYGCQGLLAIHWRHRIVDPTAGFQSRFSWNRDLAPAPYYQAYARTQAAPGRDRRLAAILNDVDRNQTILSTGTGLVNNGHAVTHEYSGDYNEGFTFWEPHSPSPAVIQSQKQVAAALAQLRDGARPGAERERVDYLTGHVEFLVSYTEAWTLAQRIQKTLDAAAKMKQAGQTEAADLVRAEAVPVWLDLAREVRRAVLRFQAIAANRSDLGTLASLHDKFVRLSLIRLRLSIEEYLGESPTEVESAYREAVRPDPQAAARLIVPTRPGLLGKGERVRIMIVAPGADPPGRVQLLTRLRGEQRWIAHPAVLLGRHTWQVTLGPFESNAGLAEYYASATIAGKPVVSPPDAPRNTYFVTLA